MFNFNKIQSLIHYGDSNVSEIAKSLKIPYTTLKSKLKANSWSPEDIEKIAEFFNKPIAYFFDKEELSIANESSSEYRRCPECERKQIEIEKLRDERDDIYRRYIECLEELCGKKGNSIKNSA